MSPSNASRTAWQTPRQRGFTLLELAITLAVLGIVLAASIPSMVGLINSGRLTANANDILTALHSARVESIRRGQRVVMCPSADGATCSTSWNDGWMVFEDRNRDGAPTGESVLYTGNLTPTLTILASSNITATNRVVFNPDGFARTAGNLLSARFAVCRATDRPLENIRDIRITAGSRFSVVRRNGSASCAAIPNT